MSSSIELPKLEAVSLIGSLDLLRRMAIRYSGLMSTLNNRSNGLQATKASNPRVLRHKALNTLGREAITSRVAGTSFFKSACKTTSVRPLSCSDDNKDGSWKTYTVITSVASKKRDGP